MAGALLFLGACGAGSGSSLAPVGAAQLTLLEFDVRPLVVRYTDSNGYAVQGISVRCQLDGPANGANVDSPVAVTDATGQAQFVLRTRNASSFKLVCRATDASFHLPIFVSKENGGRLKLLLLPGSAAQVAVAAVTIVEQTACVGLDPLRAPAPSGQVPNAAREQLPITVAGVEVNFAGLRPDVRYTVLAFGQANGQLVAFGCQDGLALTQAAIEQNTALSATLRLGEWRPEISGNALALTSRLSGAPTALRSLAGLFARMSDGENDPADYLLQRMATRADSLTSWAIAGLRSQITTVLSPSSDVAERNKLRRMASDLGRVANITLISSFEIRDEAVTSDGFVSGALSAVHRPLRFSVDVNGSARSYDLGEAFRVPRTATLTYTQADRLTIGAHTLELPLADTLVGGLLLEQFGTADVEQVVASVARCDRLGQWVATWASKNVYPGSGLIGGIGGYLATSTVTRLCQDLVRDEVAAAKFEVDTALHAAKLYQSVTLQGSAGVLVEPDGRTISKLAAGEWLGVGTFSGQRQ